MKKDEGFLQEAQLLIENTFHNHFFNEDLFNDLMCWNKQMNYAFLCNYISFLKDTMKSKFPTSNYKDIVDNFIPSYRESLKHLPSSYILFSLMSFDQFYGNFFSDYRKEEHYKKIVSILTENEQSLPFDYKTAISLHFPQYYRFKKNKVTL